MKLLVTGASGQLGRQLQAHAGEHLVVPLNHGALDITDLADVRAAVRAHRPDIVINAAAYNLVDRAQSEPLTAFATNALGPRNLALAAEDIGAAIVHISSDYVFDGRRGTPYHEFDRPNPLSVYGESKLAGELAVQQATRRHYIARTAWVYEPHGFAHAICGLAAAQPQVKVVDDQFGSPTSAEDLARGILQLIETGAYGTYHLAGGGGPASWFDFASCLLTALGIECEVVPVPGSEFPRPAPRPVYAVLTSLQSPPIALPDWRDGVARFASVLREGRS
jgi:dTDP-4-dehydrorhamnose reductase